VLDATLACYGTECDVDTARVVQIVPRYYAANDTNSSYYYEYVQSACVRYAFPEAPALIGTRTRSSELCADPLEARVVGRPCADRDASE